MASNWPTRCGAETLHAAEQWKPWTVPVEPTPPEAVEVEDDAPEVRQISYQEFLELTEGLTVRDAEYGR